MSAQQGTAAFLQQAYRNNWQRYLASLGQGRSWDTCVLTASDERQADAYRNQLEARRAAGLLPRGTRFLVLPDPERRRVGSGGATLLALARLHDDGLASGRTLVIHSGGDSKRLPHCSPGGKLFARVPRTLPDGRASTIFDEFLVSLSGLAGEAPPGVLLASGDVLLIFDHLQLSLRREGVTGVAAAAPAAMGTRHGVYASSDGCCDVRAYLHKPSLAQLQAWNGIDAAGNVQIDTGLIWLSAATAEQFVRLAGNPAVAAANLNLYGDLLLPLAASTGLESYLGDTSDGPVTPELAAARQVIWEQIRGSASLGVESLQPAAFVHFGSSHEYWHMVAGDPELTRLCGWTAQTASWLPATSIDVVAINSLIGQSQPETGEAQTRDSLRPSLIISDSILTGPVAWRGAAIVSGLQTSAPLALQPNVVLNQVPVEGGWATEILGLFDDPKQRYDSPGATYVNDSWPAWLAAAGIDAEAVWPDMSVAERSLWNARLFPLASEREASLRLALPLQEPEGATLGWRGAWLAAERLSLADILARADGRRLLDELARVEDEIAAARFYATVEAEQPAASAAAAWGQATPDALDRRSRLVAERLSTASPALQWRGYRALSVATTNPAWEDLAFAALAAAIGAAAGPIAQGNTTHSVRSRRPAHSSETVVVRAAARVDFGGGWTDTPPHSLERGGTVINAAITLAGAHPVVAEGGWLAEPGLVLESRDLGLALSPRYAGDILAHADPGDPFALLKAALVLRGIVPAETDPRTPLTGLLRPWGMGLRLATATSVPRGSGLGISSIMAGAVLACLDALLDGDDRDPSAETVAVPSPNLFADVLRLEQMLTTGGGWQDQVGGLTGGMKLVQTAPGLPQEIRVTPLRLPARAAEVLASRLMLVYTGQQRLAKNLLRAVMGRWMARDPEMVWMLGDIGRLALAMKDALESGDIDAFGALLGEHWQLNRRMDPGCSNPFIDELFAIMAPYVRGAKLAGAGGGGFAIAVARDAEAPAVLARILSGLYPGTPVAVWPCSIPSSGLIIGRQ